MTTPDLFLSYNREDAAVAKRYAEAFAAEGLWPETQPGPYPISTGSTL